MLKLVQNVIYRCIKDSHVDRLVQMNASLGFGQLEPDLVLKTVQNANHVLKRQTDAIIWPVPDALQSGAGFATN